MKTGNHDISSRYQDPTEYGPPGLRLLARVPLVKENLHVDRDGDGRWQTWNIALQVEVERGQGQGHLPGGR